MIKHVILLKIRNMMDIKEVLVQWLINFSIIRLPAEQFIRQFKKRKVQSPFRDNIYGADLAGMN